MVFITGMLRSEEIAAQVVKRCKQQGKLIVLGGPYVTSTIEELPHADHIFQGEAETTCRSFLQTSIAEEAKRTYKAPERPPLSITPVADFSLIDLKKYSACRCNTHEAVLSHASFCDIIEITDEYRARRAINKF